MGNYGDALLDLGLIGIAQQQTHHEAAMEAADRQLQETRQIKDELRAARTEFAEQAASIMRQEATQQDLLALQQFEAERQSAHDFAMWRQTPDGQALLAWRARKEQWLSAVIDREAQYRTALLGDVQDMLSQDQVDQIFAEPLMPPRPKVRTGIPFLTKLLDYHGRKLSFLPLALAAFLLVNALMFQSGMDLLTRLSVWAILVICAALGFFCFFSDGRIFTWEQDRIERAVDARQEWQQEYSRAREARVEEVSSLLHVDMRAKWERRELVIDEYPPAQDPDYVAAVVTFDHDAYYTYPTPSDLPDLHTPDVVAFTPGKRTRALVASWGELPHPQLP